MEWVKKTAIFAVVYIILLLIIKFSLIYLTPFVFAFLFAGIINPIVNYIKNKFNIERTTAVIIVLLLLVITISLLLFIGISQIYLELERLVRNLPDYNNLKDRINWIIYQNNRLEQFLLDLNLDKSIRGVIGNNLQLFYNTLKNHVVILVNNLLSLISMLPFIFTLLCVSFIATFFISRDIDIINEFIMDLFPAEWRSKVFGLEKNILSSVVGFLRAELILITVTGVIAGTGLILAGSQYALVIAITAAVLDLVPIIGPGLVFIPLIVYNTVTGNPFYGFRLLVIYTVMAAVRQGIEGKVMGTNLGLHPLAVMITLYAGYRIMGPGGFIVGPAALVLIKSLYLAGFFTDII